MAGSVIPERKKWSMIRDKEGHRTYKITWQVQVGYDDGPYTATHVAGLPTVGAPWAFGNPGESDYWAFCYPEMIVKPHYQKEKGYYWDIEQTFSTKPINRCQDFEINHPLLEPDKISGTFVKDTKLALTDRFGEHILTSSHELIRGPNNEWDSSRATVRIEQNVSLLQLDLCTSLMDKVNDAPMWGVQERCVKLTNFTWERKIFHVCTYYYTRVFDFDINFYNWDRGLLDEGTKVLRGAWDKTTKQYVAEAGADKTKSQDFIQYKDWYGATTRVILDGAGMPCTVTTNVPAPVLPDTGPGTVEVEYYRESNLFVLGIPATL